MTYKLNPSVAKITCPVIAVMGGTETRYKNGQALADATFEKNYVISSLFARNGEIVIHFEENKSINNINWVGEEKVSFF